MKYPSKLTAKAVSQLLAGIAAVYKIKDRDRFRIRAYENASVSIKHCGEDLHQLWQEKKLKEIPGVGENIAKHLDELFRTGKVRRFDQAASGIPEGFFQLLKLPGVGPKTAYKLAKKFKLEKAETAVKDLKKRAEKGEISKLPGFARETEKKLLEITRRFKKKASKRLLLYEAERYSQEIVSYLRRNKTFLKVEPLGSLRRKATTVGDIDLAVSAQKPSVCIEYFTKYPKVSKVTAKGENTARILIQDGIQIDLKAVKPEVYGSLLQHFTGSKQHNILLREYGLKKGFSLSEYGVKILKGKIRGRKKIFRREKSFYNFLGLDWIPPELREGTDEIEKASLHQLPQLVKLKDIKGDLHIHSNIDIASSHDMGESSLVQLAQMGEKLGYQYLGITDHNPKTKDLSVRKSLDLLKRRKEFIDNFNYSSENQVKQRVKKVYLFQSLEVDIKPDGSLALPEKAFPLFDYLIASIHSSFRQSKEKMTRRIIQALDYPKVKVLGHPTGRMLPDRESIEADWGKIYEKCVKDHVLLEINAWPLRLDLPDYMVREAVGRGVKFVINTDSHRAEQMSFMNNGVSVARRGWAEKKDIINTLPRVRIKSILKR